MKFTLLEITQDILNDIDGDEVSSISDTVEATQVANIVKSTYWHIVSRKDLPEHKTIFQLEETSSSTPTIMTIPENIVRIDWIQYDRKNDPGAFAGGAFGGSAFDTTEASAFNFVRYVDPVHFWEKQNLLTWTGTDVDAFTFTPASSDAFEIKYKTNANPQMYTILEDYYVIFDSIDTDISASFLEADLTFCFGLQEPTFNLSDSFTPDIDASEFNWLMEESKKAASIKLRQVDDPVARERARKGEVRSQFTTKRVQGCPDYSKFNNYGR